MNEAGSEARKILIISRRPEIYSNRRLVQELNHKNVSYQIIDPESQNFDKASIGILRIASWRFQPAVENLSSLAEKIPLMNSLESLQRARNKWLALQALAKNKISTPLTQMISREEFDFVDLQFPFVLKDLFATQGLGVDLVHNNVELQKFLLNHKDSNLFIIQDYIKECHGEDLRIFVTKRGDSWSMKRTNTSGNFRSNLHCGGRAQKERATSEELEMAFSALEIFDLDYAGVDILRTQEGPLMIEVNPAPGFEGLEEVYGPQIAGPLVDLALTKI